MGSENFITHASGPSAQAAFDAAVAAARREHGHGGYTGTIAEKRGFAMERLPRGRSVEAHIEALFEEEAFDKAGNAGCIALGGGRYVFFGAAPW